MNQHLDLDQIFLDSSNLPSFDKQQFEGQIEKPISKRSFHIFAACLCLVGLVFLGRVFKLQLLDGQALAVRSVNNTLDQIPIFAERGTITDRLGVNLAWNDNGRKYISQPGFSHLLGYTSLPKEEEINEHDYYHDEAVGRDGVEKIYNERLRGTAGIKIEERSATGEIESDYLLDPPTPGDNLVLSIDARVQGAFSKYIRELVDEGRFIGGAGVMMDVETGEIIAMTSVPEYDSNVMAMGKDREKINTYLSSKNYPFLNRAVAGAYTPGSIVKPIMALAALTEKIISPEKKILSTGQLVIPNPYFPDQPSIFRDWKAHGWVNMREAIAASSDVYFYVIGGVFFQAMGHGRTNAVSSPNTSDGSITIGTRASSDKANEKKPLLSQLISGLSSG
jgi:penicillin-binding protein 2